MQEPVAQKLKGTSLWGDAWKRLLKNKLAVLGLVVLTLMVLLVTIGPPIFTGLTGYTADSFPADANLIKSFPPSIRHPMGTDDLGRDIFARILWGGRISLAVGVAAMAVAIEPAAMMWFSLMSTMS